LGYIYRKPVNLDVVSENIGLSWWISKEMATPLKKRPMKMAENTWILIYKKKKSLTKGKSSYKNILVARPTPHHTFNYFFFQVRIKFSEKEGLR